MYSNMRAPIVFTVTALLLLLPACKHTQEVETSAPATAGIAGITLDRDKTGNGTIDLEFEHLAAPRDVEATLTVYVVWAEVQGKDPYKLGVLDYDESKRSGKLSATYAAEKFTLIMTVEQNSSVSAPIGARVLEMPLVTPDE